MTFATPNFTGVDSPFVYANTVTEGYFGMVLIMLLFAVLTVNQLRYGIKKALMVSSFITTLMTLLLTAFMDLPTTFILIPIVIFAVSVFFVQEEA